MVTSHDRTILQQIRAYAVAARWHAAEGACHEISDSTLSEQARHAVRDQTLTLLDRLLATQPTPSDTLRSILMSNVYAEPVGFAASDDRKFSAADAAAHIVNHLGGDVSKQHELMPHLLGVLRGRSKQTFDRAEVDSLAGFLSVHPKLNIGKTAAADVLEYERLMSSTPIGQLVMKQQQEGKK